MTQDFLSCDWGTSSFRLRWVSGPRREVIRELREPAGVKTLYEEAARTGAGIEAARARIFTSFLREKLAELLAGEESTQAGIPLVISGMASSSVGWHELPYARIPFSLSGAGLGWHRLDWEKPGWLGPTYLISGVATGSDVMRGEETEIIGLMSEPPLAALGRRALLILPGTHSKHVWIEEHAVIDFRTFMTGELFEVLGKQSLLRASVEVGAGRGDRSPDATERAAFEEGVLWVKEHGLAGGLFRVRTRAVLDHHPLAENTWFFSGILIGAELEQMAGAAASGPVILAAAGNVSELYRLGLETAGGGKVPCIQLTPEQVARASVAGHGLFLQNRSLEAGR